MLSSTRESDTVEARAAARPARARSHGAIGLRRVARHRGATPGIVLVAGLLLLSLLAPYVSRYDPAEPHFGARLEPPTAAYPLGTDSYGRDVLSRVAYGGRISLVVGAVSVVVGLPLGVAAGYAGGRIDDLIMRIIDVWLAFPELLLAIGIVAVLGPGLHNVMLAIGISGVPGVCRLVRGKLQADQDDSYGAVAS